MNQDQLHQQDLLLIGAMLILLILSAIPVTADFALYIGIFLLLIAIMGGVPNQWNSFFQAAFNKGNNP